VLFGQYSHCGKLPAQFGTEERHDGAFGGIVALKDLDIEFLPRKKLSYLGPQRHVPTIDITTQMNGATVDAIRLVLKIVRRLQLAPFSTFGPTRAKQFYQIAGK
jgi:hypothetical protein